jgi:exosortase A
MMPLPNTNSIHRLPFFVIISLLGLFSCLNLPILTTLWRHGFDDGTYSHAFLIPFISFYLYFKLDEIGKLQFRTTPNIYIITLLLSGALLLYGTSIAQISLGYWLATLFILTMAIASVFRINRYVLFPLLYLVFIFPFWGGLTDILQSMSVIAVTFMMGLTGIPTYVESQYVSIPAGTFEIADGCSGLRYIIVSLAISTLYIFLFIKSTKRAALFLAVAIIGGLITNWLRITILILIGHETDMTHSLMNDHNSFGWYIYIPFMFLLYMLGSKLTDIDLFQDKTNLNLNNQKPKINLVILGTIIFSFLISSTSIYSFLPDRSDQPSHTKSLSTLHPDIFFYSSIEILNANLLPKNTVYYRYEYKSKDLDAKPTYFANQYTPKDWKLEKEISNNNWQELWIFNGSIRAIAVYSFQLDSLITSNKTRYKKARLKSIFSSAKPELHWLLIPCQTNCKNESTMLKNFTSSQ